MDCGFIKLWRPYSFGGPRPKPHLAYPWAGPGYEIIRRGWSWNNVELAKYEIY
ncbi:hypothetical protein Hanom_Chr02g00143051 [Helianthus anomalus]